MRIISSSSCAAKLMLHVIQNKTKLYTLSEYTEYKTTTCDRLTVGLLLSVSEVWPEERPSSRTGMEEYRTDPSGPGRGG